MTSDAAQPDAVHDEHALAHPVPVWILLGTFAALMVLTFLTVAATWIDLGRLNIWLALFIALIKAVLVALYFMHLRWDSPFNAAILFASLFFVVLFIGIAILDTQQYQPLYAPPAGPVVQ